jgi:hypothetical protein
MGTYAGWGWVAALVLTSSNEAFSLVGAVACIFKK